MSGGNNRVRSGVMGLMRTFLALIAVLCACSSSPSSTGSVAPEPEPKPEPELSHPGCFLVYEVETRRLREWNRELCTARTSPASTFKIPHGLIGLDTGVIPDAEAVRKFNGKSSGRSEWDRAQTLVTAIRVSAVWYFQEVAQGVGRERMRKYLAEFRYGNQAVTGEMIWFWLDGSLGISAYEQLELLRRLWANDLPVAPEHMRTVQDILAQPVSALRSRAPNPEAFPDLWAANPTMSFKTGTVEVGDGSVTWLVGRVVHDGDAFIFVSRVQSEDPPSAKSPAVQAALTALLDLGLL